MRKARFMRSGNESGIYAPAPYDGARFARGTRVAKEPAVASPVGRFLFAFLVCFACSAVRGQQSSSSIERARLFQNSPNAPASVDANGTLLPVDETEASDDSFGTQVILQKRERVTTVLVAADTSILYTDNAALTPRDKIDDVLFVTSAAISWTPRINPHLEGQLAAHTSIFRYSSTSVLDFENLGFSGALFWTPEHSSNIVFSARFDFIELLDRHSRQLLRDHELTLGAERNFAVAKHQTLTLGAILMGGVAEPVSAQRQQAGVFADYHWQITKALELDLFYRLAGYFYNRADRTDCNQVLSASIRYRLSRYADLNGFITFASNRSDTTEFDYDAMTAGGGVVLTFRF
jgi:hypothetical protein